MTAHKLTNYNPYNTSIWYERVSVNPYNNVGIFFWAKEATISCGVSNRTKRRIIKEALKITNQDSSTEQNLKTNSQAAMKNLTWKYQALPIHAGDMDNIRDYAW